MFSSSAHQFAPDLSGAPHAPRLTKSEAEMAFGKYRVLPFSRALLRDGEAVMVGARAFDLLVLLLACRGQIVSKDDILENVWPRRTVDETNIRFQIGCLRRALGPERVRIKTISGRGYLFVTDSRPDSIVKLPQMPEDRSSMGQARHRANIIIIDEDPDNREALRRLLKPLDANISSFGSIEALRDSHTQPARRDLAH